MISVPFRQRCKYAGISAFAGLHAVMIMNGAARCPGTGACGSSGSGPLAAIVQAYDRITRASAVYPFFGGVGDGMVVRLRSEEKGRETIDKSEDEWGREMRLRLFAQYSLLTYYRADELLGRIYAVDVFERRPCTKKVIFALARYHIPSMAAYVRGQRPIERIMYEAAFKPSKTLRARASCALD